MSSLTAQELVKLENQKEQLRVIANRYLESEDRLPVDCTLQDIIDVLNEYDEYSYMNALFNTIEVFPDKDYSINDTQGHIKGLKRYVFYMNTALRSVYLPKCATIGEGAFREAGSNIEYIYLGEVVNLPNYTFVSCGGDIFIPKAVTTARYTFHNNDQGAGASLMTSLFAPKLRTFGIDLFFKSCTHLKNVNMASYTDIGRAAFFSNTPSFSTIVLGGTGTSIYNGNNQAHTDLNIILTHQHFVSLGGSTVATAMQYSNIFVPSLLLTTYQEGTNWSTIHSETPIQDIESHINSLRELGADFSYTPYANKKWDSVNQELVTDSTIGEEVDE